MLPSPRLLAAASALLLLSACSEKPPAPPLLRPSASIQELMQTLVDPSADTLWESVSSTVTRQGIEDRQPRTDAEWLQARHFALNLAEAANLLAVPGRTVVHAGKNLEDAHVAGNLKAEDVQRRIDANHGAFVRHAKELQAAAELALVAIDARDAQRLVEAGGRLDQACERCHLQYWYPDDKRPPELSPQR